MQLIANRQLVFQDRGTIAPGETFDIDDATARQLLAAGTAREFGAPRVLYQTKVVTPGYSEVQPEAPEVSARQPFRDSPVLDQEQADLAAEGDSVLSGADVHLARTADSGRRGRRSGSPAGR